MNNKKIAAVLVLGAFTVFGLVIEVLSFMRYTDDFLSGSSFFLITYGITCVLLLYYVVAGYKNLMVIY